MNIKSLAFSCGILAFIATLPIQANPNGKTMQPGSVTFPDSYQIKVEIADTHQRRKTGLMHRPSLPENSGMLFVYQDSAIRGVWMKNTLIPLDVLFLSDNGKVVSMLHNLQPCGKEPCPISVSTENARYMLEVTAGSIDKHHIGIGDMLLLDYD
ncbi:DUF192 domain-containing protein [Methylomonas sp. MgM2]